MPNLLNDEAHKDPQLGQYVVEISNVLSDIESSKKELSKLWNIQNNEPSNLAREIHKLGLHTHSLRSALKSDCIIKMSMILDDSQSKSLAHIKSKFHESPLSPVIVGLFDPLWNNFFVKTEPDRKILKINRNNMFAHISKNKNQNEVLGYSEKVISNFKPLMSPEHIEKMRSTKFKIIEYGDILEQSILFSDRGLDYLKALLQILSFAQIDDVFDSMVANLEKLKKDFLETHVLHKPNEKV